jgi:hypothetical protein
VPWGALGKDGDCRGLDSKARCPRVGLRPIHTLLARCRSDRAAQAAVRRQTATIPHQPDRVAPAGGRGGAPGSGWP